MQHRKSHQAAWISVVLWLGFASALAAQQPAADLDNLDGYKIAKPEVGPFDWPQWGGTSLRNNTPQGRNAPVDWAVPSESDPGRNIKWSAQVGSTAYSSPVIANGRVFIGTNNAAGYVKRFP